MLLLLLHYIRIIKQKLKLTLPGFSNGLAWVIQGLTLAGIGSIWAGGEKKGRHRWPNRES